DPFELRVRGPAEIDWRPGVEAEGAGFQHLLSLKNHRNSRCGEHDRCGQSGTLVGKNTLVVVYIYQRRQAVLRGRMTYLIMVLRIANSAKNIAGHLLLEDVLDGGKIAIRIVDLGHNLAHHIDHRVIPLAVEFEANRSGLQRSFTRAL